MRARLTREEAAGQIVECPTCFRWSTGATCDSCWVDAHVCPETAAKQVTRLRHEAEEIIRRLKVYT